MSRQDFPASQTKCKITSIPEFPDKTAVLAANLTWTHQGTTNTLIEDAATTDPLYSVSFRSGMFKLTLMTTEDMLYLGAIRNSVMVFNHANGYDLTVTGVTIAMGTEGVQENTGEGKTNELTFGFKQATQKLPA